VLQNSQLFMYLPIGVHAAADIARMVKLLGGDLKCLFCSPRMEFENRPMGKIDGYSWMRMWGYFVASSNKKNHFAADLGLLSRPSSPTTTNHIRVLWVGRMLRLKHVETIVGAVVRANLRSTGLRYSLTVVGNGKMESWLKTLARRLLNRHQLDASTVSFYPSVPIARVRKLMRTHDVYVFASNGYDGWGAVVSEALEEGMWVVGSEEAGASATILPRSCRFGCHDWVRLSDLLLAVGAGALSRVGIGKWSAESAADSMIKAL